MKACLIVLAVILAVGALLPVGPAEAQGSTCGTAPAPRLTVGQSARVTVTDGTGNNLRNTFSTTATVLGVMGDGEVFSVLTGPQCADNFWWWEVRRWDGQTGWTAEGASGQYWIEPWPTSGAQNSTGARPDLKDSLIAFLGSPITGPAYTPYVMRVADGGTAPASTLVSSDLRWSPDGTRLAAASSGDIFVFSADGQTSLNITNTPAAVDSMPAWSPDSTRLAYTSDLTETDSEILIYSATTGTTTNLTQSPAVDMMPAWSPDGARIAFVSYRIEANAADLYIATVAGGAAPLQITTYPFSEFEPAWSPDGLYIAFTVQQMPGKSDLHVYNTVTQTLLALTSDGMNYRNPVWSPDGKRVAFVGANPVLPGADALFSIRPDGTDRIQYTANPGSINGLSWSPDGNWLVFAQDPAGSYDLYAVRSNGISLVNLTNTPTTHEVFPVWQPRATPGVVITTPPGQPTPIATSAPVNPASQDLLLIYNAATPVFTLQNVAGRNLNLGPLSFSGGGLNVPTSVWAAYTASPVESFQPLGCLMIWPFGLAEQPAPPECGTARQGWITNSQYIFWTSGSFTVSYNGVTVATCDSAAGRCAVDLP